MALTGTDDDLWSALKVCLNDGDGARSELTLALTFRALRGEKLLVWCYRLHNSLLPTFVAKRIACVRVLRIFNVSTCGDLFGPNNFERSNRMNQYSGMICLMICPALSDR